MRSWQRVLLRTFLTTAGLGTLQREEGEIGLLCVLSTTAAFVRVEHFLWVDLMFEALCEGGPASLCDLLGVVLGVHGMRTNATNKGGVGFRHVETNPSASPDDFGGYLQLCFHIDRARMPGLATVALENVPLTS